MLELYCRSLEEQNLAIVVEDFDMPWLPIFIVYFPIDGLNFVAIGKLHVCTCGISLEDNGTFVV